MPRHTHYLLITPPFIHKNNQLSARFMHFNNDGIVRHVTKRKEKSVIIIDLNERYKRVLQLQS